VRRVGRGRRKPGRNGACFGDSLFEDLTVLRFAVIEQLLVILGIVELADRGVDAELAKQRLHAEGPRLIGDDRHDTFADGWILHQLREQLHEGHRGRLVARRHVQRRDGELRSLDAARRKIAAECLAAGMEVLHFRAVGSWLQEAKLPHVVVRERHGEAVAERA
jgi:hypothetical protein